MNHLMIRRKFEGVKSSNTTLLSSNIMVYKIHFVESRNDVSSHKGVSKATGYTLNLMFGFIILGLSVLFSSPTVLIPQHNAILYPEYWYEVMISASTVNSLGLVLNTMLECKIIFKEDYYLYKYLYTILIVRLIISFLDTNYSN